MPVSIGLIDVIRVGGGGAIGGGGGAIGGGGGAIGGGGAGGTGGGDLESLADILMNSVNGWHIPGEHFF